MANLCKYFPFQFNLQVSPIQIYFKKCYENRQSNRIGNGNSHFQKSPTLMGKGN